MHFTLLVRESHGLEGTLKEANELFQRALRSKVLLPARELRRQRFALEPFAHHVAHGRSRAGRMGLAAGQGLRDAFVATREPIVDAKRLMEGGAQRARESVGNRLGQVQALDCDGGIRVETATPIHDAQVRVARHGIDTELTADDLANQVEGVAAHFP